MKKKVMKKRYFLTIAAVLVVLIIIFTAGRKVEKATGNIEYSVDGVDISLSFNAHEAGGGNDVKGEVVYSDSNLVTYDADVKYVKIEDKYAYIGAEITEASDANQIGRWVYLAAYDFQTPSSDGDRIYITLTDEATASGNVESGLWPQDSLLRINSGNLKVHS